MNRTNKKRIAKLENSIGKNCRGKRALVIFDSTVDYEHDLSKIEADVILALPDNGMRGFKDGVVVGSCVVKYF